MWRWLAQVWSGLFLLAMLPRLFEFFLDLDGADTGSRAAYVKQLLRVLFRDDEDGQPAAPRR